MQDPTFSATEYVERTTDYLNKLNAEIESFWTIYQNALDVLRESRRLLEQTDHLLTRKL